MTEQQLANFLGGKLYLVGGAVRDVLAGRKPADRNSGLIYTLLFTYLKVGLSFL